MPLTADIVKLTDAKEHIGVNTRASRFVHYKQCHRFFKYSFKVGDMVHMCLQVGQDDNYEYHNAQLYAVYLDASSGAALPYWRTVSGSGNDQTAEIKQFFYADQSGLPTPPMGINWNSGVFPSTIDPESLLATIANAKNWPEWATYGASLTTTVDSSAPRFVTVVAPPDPEFLENTPEGVVGGNLVYAKDVSGNLIIRAVGERDVSGNMIQYTADNFVDYRTDPGRALLLYWVLEPTQDKTYMGDELWPVWSSVSLGTSPGSILPLRDFHDASGNVTTPPGHLLEYYKFTIGQDMPANVMKELYTTFAYSKAGIDPGSWMTMVGPRMYLPASKFIVVHDKPSEPDVPQGEFDVPFAYETANATDFNDTRKSIMGGRIMQVVSHYLFDAASNKELGFFPYLMNESKSLTDRILDALATLLKDPTISASRTKILNQILIKHGRKYFDEYAALNDTTNERIGDVWAVLNRIDEMFLFFTVTVRTTISNRTKEKVDVIRLVEVPVVIRIRNDDIVAPPVIPTENRIVYLDAADSYAGGNTWPDISGNATFDLFNLASPGDQGPVVFNGQPTNGTYALLSSLPGIPANQDLSGGLTVMFMYYRNGKEGSWFDILSGALLSINRDANHSTNACQFFESGFINYSPDFELNLIPNTFITTSGMHFRAYTVTGDVRTVKAYYNGRPDGMAVHSGNFRNPANVPIRNNAICIGRNYRDNLNQLNGVVKAALIYTRVLSDDEIASAYVALANKFM